MQQKETVQAFDQDAATGGYQYTGYKHLSAQISNAHMSAAIAAAWSLAGKHILDIGCGDGTYTFELLTQQHAAYVLGIEPSAEAVKLALATKTLHNFSNADFLTVAVEDYTPSQSFDVAILRGVLHHTDNPALAVRQALKAAPVVIILEPNGLNPVLKLIERLSPYHRAHGERSFLPSSIDHWIAEAGGACVKRRFITLVPFFCPDWAARILHKLQPLAENIPLIRRFICGQYIVVGQRPS